MLSSLEILHFHL